MLRPGLIALCLLPAVAAVAVAAVAAAAAQAQIKARFIESAGGLIFDTENGGAGVEVFQPFEAVSGQIASVSVADGAGQLSLQVPSWPEGAELSFTIDVDDVLRHGERGQTQVTGGEIAGASLRVTADGQAALGSFDNTNRAVVRGLCAT